MALMHMVFMKFEGGYFTPEVVNEIEDTYRTLSSELPNDIYTVQIIKNCIERDTNMDLLIRARLKDGNSLPIYLNHPAHIAIGKKMNPHIIDRCSFDYED